ncbi:MAG: hypothetical protein ACYC69_16335 [Thermodesulfovibrionales bacterium]
MKTKFSMPGLAALLLSASLMLPVTAGASVVVDIDLPSIVFDAPPSVAVIPGTYVYFAPDLDADILFYQGRWYRPYSGRWYWARSYKGPWRHIRHNRVPGALLRLPGDYRRGVIHDRIEYNHLHRNWRSWERDRHWHRHYKWEDRRHDRRDRRDRRDDRRDHDRSERWRDDLSDRRHDDRGTGSGGKKEIYQGFKMGDAIEKNKAREQQGGKQDGHGDRGRNQQGVKQGGKGDKPSGKQEIYQGFKMGDAIEKNKKQGQNQ